MFYTIIAFAIACLGTLILTPSAVRIAQRLGAVDKPDGSRKHHRQPVPLGGGVTVALVAILAIAITVILLPIRADASPDWLVRGLLPAAVILLIVGVIDDVRGLTGIYKLIGQVLAASVMVAAGTRFDGISLFGFYFPLGDFCIPFTIFFCLGAINSFNLIDGADALASSIGAIVCLTLGVISAGQGSPYGALVCFALAGALTGFLCYNVPPAKVYLGDTGSMLIGLVVAAVAIESSIKQQAAFALAVPLAICAIPILDAAAALVRRITTGQSVFTPDRGHLHHVLLLRGWSVSQMVGFIAGLTVLTCAAALASYYTGNDWFAFIVTGGLFVVLAVTRLFGHAEMALIASHSRSFVRSVTPRRSRQDADNTESAIQLQGRRKWQKLWTALREAAPVYNVAGLTLQVSIPQLHESFFANWNRSDRGSSDSVWRMALPLVVDGRAIGKLSLVGSCGGGQALHDMQQLIEFLDSLELEIRETLADVRQAEPNGRLPVARLAVAQPHAVGDQAYGPSASPLS